MEVVATLLALNVGAMALVRFYSKKNNTLLIVGVGFIGTGLLDGYHALATSSWLQEYIPTELESLNYWSSTGSRLFLAVLLSLGWMMWRREQRMGKVELVDERTVYSITALIAVLSFLVLAFAPLPNTYFSELSIHMPAQFFPAAFFLVALIGYVQKGDWRHDPFEHWLVIAIIVSFFAQSVFMPFSGRLFDAQYDVAHTLRIISYSCVLIGLCVSMYTTFRQIVDHELEERKQIESELRLHATAFESSEAIAITDSNARIVRVNQAFTKLTGYTQDELEGKTRSILKSGRHDDKFYQRLWFILQATGHWEGEVWNRRKDGIIYPEWLAITAIKNEQGEITNYVAIDVDITRLKHTEKKLKKREQELMRSNEELEQFAYIASHDLQEPLRKVRAFGDRLVTRYSDVLDERGLDYLSRMQDAATRMGTLINDLLSFSRVSRGQAFEPTDLKEIVRGVLSDLEVRIAEKQARIELGELCTIDADSMQMRQLFQNLIGNALKFHKSDTPLEVKVNAKPIEEEGTANSPTRMCCVRVEDNGIGFDPEYAEQIFQVFQRLHGRDEYPGTGIGLAICRKIAERHGGSLRAESRPGSGATFIVTLKMVCDS
jgi:PAS domain S-box-containing protein